MLLIEGVEDIAGRDVVRWIASADFVDVDAVGAREHGRARKQDRDQDFASPLAKLGGGHQAIGRIAHLGSGADGWHLSLRGGRSEERRHKRITDEQRRDGKEFRANQNVSEHERGQG